MPANTEADAVPLPVTVEEPVGEVAGVAAETEAPAAKPATPRARRPRKPKAAKPVVPEGS